MNEHLIDLAKRALVLKNSGKPEEAAVLFESILKEQPHWEHGYGAFSLAECYEEQGSVEKAKAAYENALRENSTDPILQGGYASFLYLHGEASLAFDAYLCLLSIDLAQNNTQGSATTIVALKELGRRQGLSQEAIDTRIAQVSRGKKCGNQQHE
jgi:tetratricopeptide (TPR) repeat protein